MVADEQDNLRAERRENEIALLQAMYPSEVVWHDQRQEMTYRPEIGGVLTLRISDEYPDEAQPSLINALDKDKDDIRNIFRQRLNVLSLPAGEEIIDSVIQAFDQIVGERKEALKISSSRHQGDGDPTSSKQFKTVIIWLHHLLNTNKRKLALNPSNDAEKLSGVTKPGYPGILLYSGDASAIDAHVAELKSQRWQAFQVRFEETSEGVWMFTHGHGIREVESMSEI